MVKKVTPNEEEIKEVARRVVLKYFQFWGQSDKERADAISQAAKLAGVEVSFEEDENGVIFSTHPEGSKWPEFLEAIKKCWPLGQFEGEEEAVAKVIKQFIGD